MAATQTPPSEPQPATTVVIDRPTHLWAEGLPLGNGEVGMMLYGGPELLTLAFNKSDVWDYRVAPGQGLPQEQTTFDQMLDAVDREDWDWLDRIYADWLDCENSSQPSLQTCGQLDLTLLPGERALSFRQELDLAAATAHVSCTSTEYREERQTVDVRTFVPARDNVVVITVNITGEARPLFGTLRLWRHHCPEYAPPAAWADGEIAGVDTSLPDSVDCTLALRVIGATGTWETTSSDAVFHIDDAAGPVTLLATVTSSLETPEPRAAATQRLKELTANAPAELEASHRRWWAAFWDRSDITLPDRRIERFWRLGLYVLASSSQPGRQAPGLQGVWNRYNRPTWHTDYHADMNTQMIYWPAYAANHLDICEPYYRLLADEMRDEARRAAKEFFGRRGLFYPIAGGPHGHELAAPWAWPGAGAWLTQHFWWHWMFSRDMDFLREFYPFLKELSEFYEDFLTEDADGIYTFGPSYAPEMRDARGYLIMAWGHNPTGDLAFVRILFDGLIEAAELLDIDPADRARWTDIRDHLPEYPTDGRRFHDLAGDRWQGKGPMPVTISPLWPAGDVTVDSDSRLVTAATGTWELFRDHFKCQGHNCVWAAAAATHLGLGDQTLSLLNHYIDTHVVPSGLHVLMHDGVNAWSGLMQIDATTAFAAAVNEMLLQSLGGTIRVFPAVPDEWHDVSFRTMRAVGAMLVSATRRQGRTASVQVESECGGPCRVKDPFGTGRACLKSREERVSLTAGADGMFVFETDAGGVYELTAAD